MSERILGDPSIGTPLQKYCEIVIGRVALAGKSHQGLLHALNELRVSVPQNIDGPLLRDAIRNFAQDRNDDYCGLEARVWKSVRKTMMCGLFHSGLEPVPRRDTVDISCEWLAIIKRVARSRQILKSDVDHLRRFARWASGNLIWPHHVNQSHIDTYKNDLVVSYDVAQARDKFLGFCNAWTRAVAAFPNLWPQVPINWTRRQWESYSLAEYPEQLQAELHDMLIQRRGCDEDMLSPWRSPITATTERGIQYQFRRLLFAVCMSCGTGPDEVGSLKMALLPENVDGALMWLAYRYYDDDEQKPERNASLYCLAVEARNVARCYLKLPASDLLKFDVIVSAHNPQAKGRSEATIRTLLRLTHPEFLNSVLQLMKTVLWEYGHAPKGQQAKVDVEAALAACTGILLALPLAQLATLRIGEEFVITGDFERVHYRARNSSGFNTAELVEMPEIWIKLLRLHVALSGVKNEGSAWLFPGDVCGRKKNPTVLSRRIDILFKNRLGHSLTAGYLQDVAIALRLQCDPGDFGGSADMVGHLNDAHIKKAFGSVISHPVFNEHDASLCSAKSHSNKESML